LKNIESFIKIILNAISEINILFFSSKNLRNNRQGMVVQTCNPSYWRGKGKVLGVENKNKICGGVA
jgi:hypothetical protein